MYGRRGRQRAPPLELGRVLIEEGGLRTH